MTRVLKFRGKTFGQWDYATSHDDHWEQFWALVDHKTVGQFTGLIDCNSKEIYEGDIVTMPGARQAMWIEYQAPEFVMRRKTPSGNTSTSWSTFDLHYPCPQFQEIIGNIHDNSELLKTQA